MFKDEWIWKIFHYPTLKSKNRHDNRHRDILTHRTDTMFPMTSLLFHLMTSQGVLPMTSPGYHVMMSIMYRLMTSLDYQLRASLYTLNKLTLNWSPMTSLIGRLCRFDDNCRWRSSCRNRMLRPVRLPKSNTVQIFGSSMPLRIASHDGSLKRHYRKYFELIYWFDLPYRHIVKIWFLYLKTNLRFALMIDLTESL